MIGRPRPAVNPQLCRRRLAGRCPNRVYALGESRRGLASKTACVRNGARVLLATAPGTKPSAARIFANEYQVRRDALLDLHPRRRRLRLRFGWRLKTHHPAPADRQEKSSRAAPLQFRWAKSWRCRISSAAAASTLDATTSFRDAAAIDEGLRLNQSEDASGRCRRRAPRRGRPGTACPRRNSVPRIVPRAAARPRTDRPSWPMPDDP